MTAKGTIHPTDRPRRPLLRSQLCLVGGGRVDGRAAREESLRSWGGRCGRGRERVDGGEDEDEQYPSLTLAGRGTVIDSIRGIGPHSNAAGHHQHGRLDRRAYLRPRFVYRYIPRFNSIYLHNLPTPCLKNISFKHPCCLYDLLCFLFFSFCSFDSL